MTFTEQRIPFICMSDKEVVFADKHVELTRDWALTIPGVTPEFFEKATRGYIMKGRIQFFQGSNYICAHVSARMLDKVIEAYKCQYNEAPTEYFNGCKVGTPGEVWQPLRVINLKEWH